MRYLAIAVESRWSGFLLPTLILSVATVEGIEKMKLQYLEKYESGVLGLLIIIWNTKTQIMNTIWLITIFALFTITALAEISGCYAAHAWLRMGRSARSLVPGGFSLAIFTWLLTLQPTDVAGIILFAPRDR